MSDFIIDSEVQALLPVPTNEERNTLEQMILDGLHVDKLVVGVIDGVKILVDGHTRQEICDRHGVPYSTREKKFPNRDAMLQWVIDNQLGRRNLTDERRAYYIGKEYLAQRKAHGGPRVITDNSDAIPSGQNDHLDKTRGKVAKKHGVSDATVRRDAEFAEGVEALEPEAKEQVLSGQATATKAEVATGVFCKRCQRVGPTKNCAMCKELREAKPSKKAKTEKNKDESTEQVDAYGTPVPKRCKGPLFDPWIQETIDFLGVLSSQFWGQRMADGLNKRKKHYPFFDAKEFADGCGQVGNDIDKLLEHLKEFRPAGVCPACEGAGCAKCKMTGLVHRSLYEKLKAK